MAKPFPSQNSLNFAAVSFAIQYYKREEHLLHAFKYGVGRHESKKFEKSQVIREWVTHFAVARNLTGFGSLSSDERDLAYVKIFEILSSWHAHHDDRESQVDRVLRVEGVLRKELNIETSLLSATSKLLWLVDKESIIYDGIVRKNLATADGDYRAFCEKWEAEFRTLSSGIEAAANALMTSLHLFPESWDLRRDCMRPWFLRRIFDTLHWLS